MPTLPDDVVVPHRSIKLGCRLVLPSSMTSMMPGTLFNHLDLDESPMHGPALSHTRTSSVLENIQTVQDDNVLFDKDDQMDSNNPELPTAETTLASSQLTTWQ